MIDLSLSLDGGAVPTRIQEVTEGKGVCAIIDAVGGPLLVELVQSAAFGGKVILYGGLSEQRFQLHNNDIYLKGLTIESYIYRHFFTPPAPEEGATLREMIDIAGDPSFMAPVSGRYRFEEYKAAVSNSFSSSPGSSSGKGLFVIE